MAFFFSTFLLTPLLSFIKYILYIYPIFKPKTKFKAKPKAKFKIIKFNPSKAGSLKYNREWANINNFLTNLLNFKALYFLDLKLLVLVKAINLLSLLY